MLKLGTVRFRARCRRHPRYNPALEGEVAIRGGCPQCHLLLDIYKTHRSLVMLIQKANETMRTRSVTPAASSANDTQMDLFAALTAE